MMRFEKFPNKLEEKNWKVKFDVWKILLKFNLITYLLNNQL